MQRRKTLKELTLKDNFMFAASMIAEPDNCAGVIERATGIPVDRVEVVTEKSILYHPEYKGIRLDVYARDENHTHYDIEMQVLGVKEIAKRARYYHSQIDMELLLSGKAYAELPKSIVIFICDFDPFGYKKYRYTFESTCQEEKSLCLEDGSITIFLSTRGTNEREVPEALVKLMKFVKADLEESQADFGDDFVRQLQKTIRNVKASREVEGQYMLLEELLREERREGKEEGREEGRVEGRAEVVLELLEELGNVPEELQAKIFGETDLERLSQYIKLAVKAESIEQFAEAIQ